jgi:hypothetical protein
MAGVAKNKKSRFIIKWTVQTAETAKETSTLIIDNSIDEKSRLGAIKQTRYLLARTGLDFTLCFYITDLSMFKSARLCI